MRAVEEKALVDLGAALRKLGRERSIAVLFFPMNADQYGFSDLTIAAKLRRQLDGVEYRVWHAEPGVDAVICFLQRVHVVVAMRFHACIFALSQHRPTLALDYSLRGMGKVGRLMQERGLAHEVVSVTAIDPDFVAAKLRELDRRETVEQSCRSTIEPALLRNRRLRTQASTMISVGFTAVARGFGKTQSAACDGSEEAERGWLHCE